MRRRKRLDEPGDLSDQVTPDTPRHMRSTTARPSSPATPPTRRQVAASLLCSASATSHTNAPHSPWGDRASAARRFASMSFWRAKRPQAAPRAPKGHGKQRPSPSGAVKAREAPAQRLGLAGEHGDGRRSPRRTRAFLLRAAGKVAGGRMGCGKQGRGRARFGAAFVQGAQFGRRGPYPIRPSATFPSFAGEGTHPTPLRFSRTRNPFSARRGRWPKAGWGVESQTAGLQVRSDVRASRPASHRRPTPHPAFGCVPQLRWRRKRTMVSRWTSRRLFVSRRASLRARNGTT